MKQYYYAIRHKPTEKFLPNVPAGHRNGATFCELTDKAPPRLFRTGQHAASALRHWLEGKKSLRYNRNSDWLGEDDSRYENVDPVPTRKANEMEIVRVRIKVDHV